MSRPIPVLSDRYLLITRRCISRDHLFDGHDDAGDLFRYLLAVAGQRFDIEILGFALMANHYHIVVLDRSGRHPSFTRWLNAMIARCFNRLLKRTDRFWDGRPVNVVDLLDDDAVVRKLAYIRMNPTRAGIATDIGRVRSCLDSQEPSEPEVLERPAWMSGKRTALPENIILKMSIFKPRQTAHRQSDWAQRYFAALISSPNGIDEPVHCHKTTATPSTVPATPIKEVHAPTGQASLDAAGSVHVTPNARQPRRLIPRAASSDTEQLRGYLELLRRFQRLHLEARRGMAEGIEGSALPLGSFVDVSGERSGVGPTLKELLNACVAAPIRASA